MRSPSSAAWVEREKGREDWHLSKLQNNLSVIYMVFTNLTHKSEKIRLVFVPATWLPETAANRQKCQFSFTKGVKHKTHSTVLLSATVTSFNTEKTSVTFSCQISPALSCSLSAWSNNRQQTP